MRVLSVVTIWTIFFNTFHSCIYHIFFFSTLDLRCTFILVALMKQNNVFHFCIFYFSAFIFPKTSILSCPKVQIWILPIMCPKDLVSLSAFSQDHRVSIFLFLLGCFLFIFSFCTHIIEAMFISHSGNLSFFSFSQGLPQGQWFGK